MPYLEYGDSFRRKFAGHARNGVGRNTMIEVFLHAHPGLAPRLQVSADALAQLRLLVVKFGLRAVKIGLPFVKVTSSDIANTGRGTMRLCLLLVQLPFLLMEVG